MPGIEAYGLTEMTFHYRNQFYCDDAQPVIPEKSESAVEPLIFLVFFYTFIINISV